MHNIPPACVRAWVARHFPYKERKGGQEIRICSPFSPDTGYNFEISTITPWVHDWRGDFWVGLDPNTGQRRKCTFIRFVQLYLTKVNGTCSYRAAVEDVMGS